MRLFTQHLWNYLRSIKSRVKHNAKRSRLAVELLEDRLAPANASGAINGFVFYDSNNNGAYNTGSEPTLPGVPVQLSGTTTQGTAVNVSATTDSSGAFRFQNVLPGTYKVVGGPVATLLSGGTQTIANITVSATGTVTPTNFDLGFLGGLAPSAFCMNQFLTESPSAPSNFPHPPAGAGQAKANFRDNNTPTISKQIATVRILSDSTAPTVVNLAGHFSDADLSNTPVSFHITNGDKKETIKLTLFDKTAPQTVTNFLDYVNSNAFDKSIFSRLVSGFVLQGGGAKLNAAGDALSQNTPLDAIPNEFGATNAANTIAMAQSNDDPDSATNQFFFNLVNNGAGQGNDLDSKKFTVFGSIADSESRTTLQRLALTPTHNESTKLVIPTVDLKNVPLTNYNGSNFPTDAKGKFMVIDDISIDTSDHKPSEFLNYTVISVKDSVTNSDSTLVKAQLANEKLQLSFNGTPGQVGSVVVTVRTSDRYGATVQQSFTVNVAPTITSVSITPDVASAVTTLTANPVSPAAQTNTFTYQWLRNSSVLSGQTNKDLDLSAVTVNVGDKFSVKVTPSNTNATGDPFTSSFVTIQTAPPDLITLV